METVSRFMVRNVGYPWKSDPNYRRPEQPQVIGAHPLVRADKYNDEFEKLNDEVKSILLAQRASVLSSPLPFPILTEPNLHLYNTIHYHDDEAQLPCEFLNSFRILSNFILSRRSDPDEVPEA